MTVLPVNARAAPQPPTGDPTASRANRAAILRSPLSSGKIGVIVVVLVLLAGALALLNAFRLSAGKAPSARALVGRLDPHWPLPGSAPGTLSDPSAVAVDAAGTVYVADTGNDRIDRFSSGGRFLGSYGSPGASPGQLRRPKGIAVDGSGNIYVSDTGNNRIQKFSAEGKWLASWGSWGRRLGRLNSPQGLALDSSANLYVADRDNDRIQEFSRIGVFLHAWGPGIPTGPDMHSPPALHRPLTVTLDAASNIYVVDEGYRHLHEFSPYAVPLGDWGTTGSGPGGLTAPDAIAVQVDGTIVVGQSAGSALVEYAATSHHLLRLQPRSGGIHATGIAPGSDGTVLVADASADRVLRITRAGTVPARFGRPPVEPAGLRSPGALAVGPTGDLYVADTGHRRVVKLIPDGRPVAQFARALGVPRSVAVAPATGAIYVLDSAHNRVRRFSAAGKLLSSWGGFGDPRGIAVDTAGNVYVTDDTAGTMEEFTASGTRVATETIAPPQISNGIAAIAVDRHGTTYVAVPGQGTVLQFSPAGQLLAQWAHFHGDIAVAVDRLGHVFVADAGRFQELSSTGQVLRAVRLPGSAHSERTSPVGIAVDARFDVFVSDSASNRILKFSPNTSG